MEWPDDAPRPGPLAQTRETRLRIDSGHADAIAPLLDHATRVRLTPRQVLGHGQQPIDHVYFVESGLVSVLAKVGKQRWVEAWMVGANGFVGLPAMANDERSPNRWIVHIGGYALRVAAPRLRSLFESDERLRSTMLAQLGAQFLQASQTGACNAQHTAIQRVARWLLVACDEHGEPILPLSHEMLARAIGLRRATVSECIKALDDRRAIATRRRLIELADIGALREAACDCHRIIAAGRLRREPL